MRSRTSGSRANTELGEHTVRQPQSTQRFVKVSLDPVGDLWQFFPGVLQEMRGGAVRFERRVVFIQFVDEKTARFRLVAVYLIGCATGFLAGFLCQLGED